jgi:hypothetical protein
MRPGHSAPASRVPVESHDELPITITQLVNVLSRTHLPLATVVVSLDDVVSVGERESEPPFARQRSRFRKGEGVWHSSRL